MNKVMSNTTIHEEISSWIVVLDIILFILVLFYYKEIYNIVTKETMLHYIFTYNVGFVTWAIYIYIWLYT
jgi:hypothetical protein